MKFPLVIDAKGKLVESIEIRLKRRRKAIEAAKWALKYGKEGVDYYV